MGTAKPYFWASRNAWYINVRVNGKVTKRKLGDTKKQAYDVWKSTIRSQVSLAGDPTVASVAMKYLEKQGTRLDAGEVSASWVNRTSRTLNLLALLNLRCSELTHLWADKWIIGKSANYARTELATVRQMLDWAVNVKLLDSNPLNGYRLPQMQSRDRLLTLKEHNQMCRAATRKFKQILRFAWLTGSRPGELRALQWKHISGDLSYATLTSHKSAKKTRKPRVIYFPKRAQALLKHYKRYAVGEFVFINTRNKPWTKNAIVLAMQRIREKTGLDAVAYNYRHTWITRALLSGVDVATVATLSGHSSVAMIARVYGHLDQHSKHLSNAVGKIV